MVAPGVVLQHGSSALRLYVEEVKALPRGRFALAGASTLLAVLALLAVLTGSIEAGLYGYGLLAYVVVPSALAVFSAAQVASPRATRFVDALFTAPVTKGQVLLVHVLVSLTLGFAYLLATLPFLGVYAFHGVVPEILLRFLAAGAALVLVSTAVGTFLGVAFTGRSLTAPVTLAGGIMLLTSFAVPFLQLIAPKVLEGGASGLVRLAHLSPQTHVLGIAALLGSFSPAAPTRAALAVAAIVVGFLALAAWTFLRYQGVDAWEVGTGRRAAVALGALLLLGTPAVVADTAYVPTQQDLPMGLGAASLRLDAALVPRGTPLEEARFNFRSSDPDAIPVGRATSMDLLVRFDVAASTPVRNVTLTVASVDGRLLMDGRVDVTLARLEAFETDARTSPPAPVLRVPVTVTPLAPKALGASAYNMNVTGEYDAEGSEVRIAYANFLVFGEVPGGILHLALAGAPLVLLTGSAAVTRAVRTR